MATWRQNSRSQSMMRPCWSRLTRVMRSAGLPGADPALLTYPLQKPGDFDARGFVLPVTLKPESFRPDVLLQSLIKRTWLARFKN